MFEDEEFDLDLDFSDKCVKLKKETAGPSRDQHLTGDSRLTARPSRDQQSKSSDSVGNSYPREGSFQGGVKRGIENERVRHHVVERQREKLPQNNGNKPKRRFPGPAGRLPILKPGNLALVVDEDEEDENTDLQYSQENAENAHENAVWIKALHDLGMEWGDPNSLVSKYNVNHIKQNAKPGSSIRMPILVVRIKNLDSSCLDPICRLRDPNGEVGGSIHRDVIDQFGAQIQVGSILVLRNVIVLMTRKTQYVNITVTNMVSIYLPDSVTHIHTVNVKDMQEGAEQMEKVRREQLKQIQEVSLASAQPVASRQPPAFSVPGQNTGARMMSECPSPNRTPGPSSLRTPGPSPIWAPGPYERRQQNAPNNVRQKITESFLTPQSQASSVTESQNMIASMMEGLDSNSLFGDF